MRLRSPAVSSSARKDWRQVKRRVGENDVMVPSDVENPLLLCASTNSHTFQALTLMAYRTIRFAMKILSALEFPIVITPLPVIEAVRRAMLDRILAKHPGLFERLGDYKTTCFCFSPTDIPLRFLITPAFRSVSVRRRHTHYTAGATVEASLADLLGMLTGNADGDALFFSRSVAITGSMEAVLALRNALDDTEIDLVDDIVGKGSPLRPFAKALLTYLMPKEESRAWN